MTHGFGRRLLTALAGSTPAFTRHANSDDRSLARRLLAALAGTTPAFTPGFSTEQYVSTASPNTRIESTAAPAGSEVMSVSAPLEQFVRGLMQQLSHRDRLVLRLRLSTTELDISHALAMACIQYDSLLRDLAQDKAVVHDHLLILVHDLANGLALRFNDLALPDDFASALNRAFIRILSGRRILSVAYSRSEILAHADELAHEYAHALVEAFGQGLVVAFRYAFENAIEYALQNALNNALNRDQTSELAAGLRALVAMFTDFTTADLASIDLNGVDLRGVRWSMLSTRWPPGWESLILEMSEQVAPDDRPDLYEVRDNLPVRQAVQ